MDYNERLRQNRIRRLERYLSLNRLRLYSVPIQYIGIEESDQSIYVNQARNNRIARLNIIRSARLRRHGRSLSDSRNMNVINSTNALSMQCEDSVESLEPWLSRRSSEQSGTTSSNINVHTGDSLRVHSTAGADGELHMSRNFQDKKTSECKNEPQNALTSVERIEMVENATESTDSQSTDAPPVACSVKPESIAIVECNLLNAWPSVLKSFPNYPALEPTWCGSFEILDSVSRSEFFDGFLAHPPGKGHHKALEFSKQMPGVLLCTLLPGSDVWVDVFHDDCPNLEDVSLYFFPGSYERSKQQYTHLLGHMETQDLVIKSCVDGVELLIFSSTRLHGDLCGLKLKLKFLCGVCRHLKSNTTFPLLPVDELKSQECTQFLCQDHWQEVFAKGQNGAV